MTSNPRPIRVLVIDDSALMRQMLTAMIDAAPDLTVVAAAADPLIAREMIKAHDPDVLTLDIEMPRMDGLAFLEKVMSLRPMPVLMVSSLTESGADATLRALELGAIDVVAKPKLDLGASFPLLREELWEKLRAAHQARTRLLARRGIARTPAPGTAPAVAGSRLNDDTARLRSTEMVVAIGASTGGVEALREIVTALPAASPALLITQHMPEKFTTSFAARLDGLARLKVSEARDGARVLPGHAYLAPGNRHLRLARSGADFICRVEDGPLISGHKPSVDALFHSVATVAGANALGVILTGMGRDGADGLAAMRRAGAFTIGQDEASSVVYGMPKAAKALDAVVSELPLPRIAEAILDNSQNRAIRF